MTYLDNVAMKISRRNMHRVLVGHCAFIVNNKLQTPDAEVRVGAQIKDTGSHFIDWGAVKSALARFSIFMQKSFPHRRA